MGLTGYFFDTTGTPPGDRAYSSSDEVAWLYNMMNRAAGVLRGLDSGLALSSVGGLVVRTATGAATIGGRAVINDANMDLTVPAVSVGFNRVDRIVLRVDIGGTRAFSLVQINGTPATNPTPATAPAITSATDILLGSMTTTNTTGTYSFVITDERAYTDETATVPFYNKNYIDAILISTVTPKLNKSDYVGRNWSVRVNTESNTWESVAYGGGKWVAVSSDGTHRVMYSTDGKTWTVATAAEANDWHSVRYGNGQFIAISGSGTHPIMTSPNGISWTARSFPITGGLDLVYAAGIWVAVSYDVSFNAKYVTSTDGITWTAGNMGFTAAPFSVCYANGKFVMVSAQTFSGGYTGAAYSTDGVTWVASNSGSGMGGVVVASDGTRFVAVSPSQSTIWYSDDAITWTQSSFIPSFTGGFDTTPLHPGIIFGYGKFIIVGGVRTSRTPLILMSETGDVWTQQYVPECGEPMAIGFNGSQFVSVGCTGTKNRILSSESSA